MLHCDFQYQHADLQLQIQLELHQGILGIVGASGVGKSTLLQCIAGLHRPQHGIIQLAERRLLDTKNKIDIALHQRNIALIFQQALLFPHMSVQQNLRYAMQFKSPQAQRFSFQQVVDLLELQPLIQRKAHQLSGGEAQRVSIGRALLSSPQLLLLDEPLTGLDLRLKDQILYFLMQIHQETALPMIYVTHHAEELQYLHAAIYQLKTNLQQLTCLYAP